MPDHAAEKTLQAARTKLSFLRPYFNKALYGLIMIENADCPAMSVDEYWRVSYNPAWVKKTSVDIVATVMLEKVNHRIRQHAERFREIGVTLQTMEWAQAAACMEIQDDLYEELASRRDLPLMPDSLDIRPSMFGFEDHKIAELYYRKMVSDPEKFSYRNVRTDGKAAPPANTPFVQASRNISTCRCGSGATGVPCTWEHPSPRDGGPFGLESADRLDVIARTATDVLAHATSKGIGSVPGSLVEWAKSIVKPKPIPWETTISATVRRSLQLGRGRVVRSYQRPSRRQDLLDDIVMPGLRGVIPQVVIIGDTSGSMSAGKDSDLALVRGVVEDACRRIGGAVKFLAVDRVVHGGVQNVKSGLSARLAGRGGTDMGAGIHYAVTQIRPQPDLITIVSDCATDWPSTPPPQPTKVLICGVNVPAYYRDRIPKWATFLNVDPRPTV